MWPFWQERPDIGENISSAAICAMLSRLIPSCFPHLADAFAECVDYLLRGFSVVAVSVVPNAFRLSIQVHSRPVPPTHAAHPCLTQVFCENAPYHCSRVSRSSTQSFDQLLGAYSLPFREGLPHFINMNGFPAWPATRRMWSKASSKSLIG